MLSQAQTGIPLHVQLSWGHFTFILRCGIMGLPQLYQWKQMEDISYLGDLPLQLRVPNVLSSTSTSSGGKVGEPNRSLTTAVFWIEPLGLSFSQPLRHSAV